LGEKERSRYTNAQRTPKAVLDQVAVFTKFERKVKDEGATRGKERLQFEKREEVRLRGRDNFSSSRISLGSGIRGIEQEGRGRTSSQGLWKDLSSLNKAGRKVAGKIQRQCAEVSRGRRGKVVGWPPSLDSGAETFQRDDWEEGGGLGGNWEGINRAGQRGHQGEGKIS